MNVLPGWTKDDRCRDERNRENRVEQLPPVAREEHHRDLGEARGKRDEAEEQRDRRRTQSNRSTISDTTIQAMPDQERPPRRQRARRSAPHGER
jgi:hypothetical protein